MVKSTVCGVSLATWGTQEGAGNGMLHYADTKLFGGSVGHASLSITFPANEQTREWIRQYCMKDPPIPYEKQKIETNKAVLNEQGQYVNSNEKVREEEVYVVHFSWFPGEGTSFSLSSSLNRDNRLERFGVNVDWDPRFKDYINPEQRIHRGKLGQREMTYGATVIDHERNLNNVQKEYVALNTQSVMLSEALDSLSVVEDKMKKRMEFNQNGEIRKAQILNKKDLIKEHQDNISLLNKIQSEINENTFNLNKYPAKQQEYLKKIFPENIQNLSEIDIVKAIKIEKSTLNNIQQDSKAKFDQDSIFSKGLSKTEIIILDRQIPNWREQTHYQEGQQLNTGTIDNLFKIVKQKEADINAERGNIFEQQKALKNAIGETTARAKVKELQIQHASKNEELKKIKHQLKGKPLSEDLHRQALLIQKEMKEIEQKSNEIKSSDNYKYEYLNSYVISDWEDVVKHLDKILETNKDNFKNKDDTVDLDKKVINDLDSAFSRLVDDGLSKHKIKQITHETHWHNNHVKKRNDQFTKISKEEALELREFAQKQIVAAKDKAMEIEPGVSTFLAGDHGNFSTYGTPPDNLVQMRLSKDGGFEQGLDQGMNVEAMLSEMHKITTEGKNFDLDTNNCSVTVGRILEAGAQGPHLKSQFQNKALGAIGNPQMVMNNALKYQAAVKDPNDTILKKIGRFNPIKTAGGWCVNTLALDKEASAPKIIAAGAAIVPIAIAGGLVTSIKKLSNPEKTFKELTSFVGYANSRPSTAFKIGAAVVAAPALAVLAIPAGIQMGVTTATSAVTSTLKNISATSNKESTLESNVDLNKADFSKGLSIEAKIKQELKDKTIEIKGDNLKDALANFKQALDQNKGPVVLDQKTEKMVLNQISKIKDKTSREAALQNYNDLCQVSAERVQALQKGVLAANGIGVPSPEKLKEQADNNQEVKKEELVLIQEAKYERKTQFYSVMPILGDELGEQITSYAMFSPAKSTLTDKQKELGIPRSVDPEDVIPNAGYLASQETREHIIQLFKQDNSLQEITADSTFPTGHPQEGQKIGFDAFKDNNGNIFVINPTVLGQGGYGTVKVIQAIEVPNKDGPVAEKGFYAVKIQNVFQEEVSKLDDIRDEMRFNEQFGLHFGDMLIDHKVLTEPPKYALASDAPKNKVLNENVEATNNDKVSNNSTNIDNLSSIKINDDLSSTKINDNLSSAKINDNLSSTKLNDNLSSTKLNDDLSSTKLNDNLSSTKLNDNLSSTKLNDNLSSTAIKDNVSSTAFSDNVGSIAINTDNQKHQPPNFFANYDFKVDYTAYEDSVHGTKENDEAKLPSSLDKLAEQQKPPTEVSTSTDLEQFDVLRYLELFEKMTVAVENVHSKGILHRDIKAENFLYDAHKGELRIIDFGLAKRMDDPTLGSPSEMCEGSPHNFSPEHFHDDYKEKVSTKQDIYALGRTCGLLMHHELVKHNSDAYREDVPTPQVGEMLRDVLTQTYLENFRFKNDDNNPHVRTINQMMQLLNEMNDLNVNNRPEAADIKMRLQAMIVDYKKAMNIEQSATVSSTMEKPSSPQVVLNKQPQPSPSEQALDEVFASLAAHANTEPPVPAQNKSTSPKAESETQLNEADKIFAEIDSLVRSAEVQQNDKKTETVSEQAKTTPVISPQITETTANVKMDEQDLQSPFLRKLAECSQNKDLVGATQLLEKSLIHIKMQAHGDPNYLPRQNEKAKVNELINNLTLPALMEHNSKWLEVSVNFSIKLTELQNSKAKPQSQNENAKQSDYDSGLTYGYNNSADKVDKTDKAKLVKADISKGAEENNTDKKTKRLGQ